MNEIRLENIHKSFDGKQVLAGFQATFPAGQATCIMGSSGCGKTTLLNILLGLLPPDEGRVLGMPERVGYSRRTGSARISLPFPISGWLRGAGFPAPSFWSI